ncbi:hypothetical protein CPB84DRAFT_167851 [Gymnopilus junonius]|uniref:Uncharacterized protein n=1 Tax=Gymnopilus junonius TaxID=109634 RepID=A0A9P5NU16_GYMJU|nr:hypothetical protein CPB84DRAFT_167851 [Gymnopilus junonius]
MSLNGQKETPIISDAWSSFLEWHQKNIAPKAGGWKGSRASNESLETARDIWADHLKKRKYRPFSWPTTSEEINQLKATLNWRPTEMWSTISGYCRITSDEADPEFDPGRTHFTTWHKEINAYKTSTESVTQKQEAAGEAHQKKPPKVSEDLGTDESAKEPPVAAISPHLFRLSPFSSGKIWGSGDDAQALRNFAVKKWRNLSKEFYEMVMEHDKDMLEPLRFAQSEEGAEKIINSHLQFLLKLAHQIYENLESAILGWDGKEEQDEKEDMKPEEEQGFDVNADRDHELKTESEDFPHPSTTEKGEEQGRNTSDSPERPQNSDKEPNQNRQTPILVKKKQEISSDVQSESESDADASFPRHVYRRQRDVRQRSSSTVYNHPPASSIPRRHNWGHLRQHSGLLNEPNGYPKRRPPVHTARYPSRTRPYSYPDLYTRVDGDQSESECERAKRKPLYPAQAYVDDAYIEAPRDVPYPPRKDYYGPYRRDSLPMPLDVHRSNYPLGRVEMPVEMPETYKEERDQHEPMVNQSHLQGRPRIAPSYRPNIRSERLQTSSPKTMMRPPPVINLQSRPQRSQRPNNPPAPVNAHHQQPILPEQEPNVQHTAEDEYEMRAIFKEIEAAYARSAEQNAKVLALDTVDIIDTVYHRMEEGRAGYEIHETTAEESSEADFDSHLLDTSDTEISSMIEVSENHESECDRSSTPTPGTPIVNAMYHQRGPEYAFAALGRNENKIPPPRRILASVNNIPPMGGILGRRASSAVQPERSVHWAKAPEIRIFHKPAAQQDRAQSTGTGNEMKGQANK